MKKTDINIAKELLGQNDRVCVIVKNGEVLFSSSQKGIQPFFDALETCSKIEYLSSSIADRVIGKAAVMLAAYLGVHEIYTPLASQHAIDAAHKLGLTLDADKIVPYIINRTQDGMCPMESAVLNIDEPKDAFDILSFKLQTIK
jgi:hypothetical protein